MKRFSLILATALIAALVCWWLIPQQKPSSSATERSAPKGVANPANNSVATVAADDPSTSGTETGAGIDSATEAIVPKTSKPTNASALKAARAAALLSRTPKGIWAERAPSIEDYISDIPAVHLPALTEFRTRFPDLDPTENQDFAKATMRQRETYGETLDEKEATRFGAWLLSMESMQAATVASRAKLVGVTLHGSEPIDLEGTSRSFSLIGFEGITPRYSYTQNAAAAESTGANLVRFVSSYDPLISPPADGTGLYVNVNDHGTIYEHTEFQLPNSGGSRIVYKEIQDSGDRNHMTHCAGTVGAWGYNSNLLGMAPRVWIRSHIQQSTSDIIAHGMMWPGQMHSTNNPVTNETEMKSVMGTTSLGWDFTGPYSSWSASFDSTLRDYPYYVHFYAAANNGSAYNTLSADHAMAKNTITIANVNDTQRDDFGNYVSGGSIRGSSSRGPTQDGRIKPDISANGVGLTSTTGTNGSSSYTGTSMATPNASGSTTLLIDYIRRKLPGHYFRSSTLRALLVNTADDMGNAGPDYIYGYGIINVKAAADIIKQYAENPSSRVILEDTLSSGQTWTQTYTYDGTGPIRLTLCWLDPAGVSQSSTSTDRTPRLVNDLNLRLIGPEGTTYEPFVMPFTTGNGTYSAYDTNLYGATAVTGNNFTDNQEQILVATPSAGTYTLQVSHSGSLQNNSAQPFSLAISGLYGTSPVAPNLSSISPEIGNSTDNFIMTLNGNDFVLGSDVFLRRAAANGSTDEAKGYGVIIIANRMTARFDTASLAKGYWDVVVRAPDGTESILPEGFLLPNGSSGSRSSLYANDFESGTTGLTLGTGWAIADPNKASVSGPADAQQGSNALVTYPGAEYAGDVTSYATLPAISTISYSNIQLEIQRWLGIRKQGSSTDYARVQYSLNGSSWIDLASHNNLIESSWGAQTYTLPAAAEGQSSVYLRFSLETDASNHSFGWNIDDLKVTAAASATSPPRFTSTAVTTATQGEAYSYTITTTDPDTAGVSLDFGATGLPDGLSLSPNGSGGATLAGTPTVSGVFTISLSVSDGSYTTYQNFNLTCYPPGGNAAPVITTSTLPTSYVGETYSATVAATDAEGHSLILSLTSTEPDWLALTDHGDGTATLTGIPPVDAQTSYTLEVAASDGFDTTTASLTLSAEPRAIVGFSSPTASVDENAGTVSLTVTRTTNSAGAVSLSYSCNDGTANSGDYTAVTDTLSWGDGDSTSRSIVIPIVDNSTYELDESFTVTLSSLSGIADFGTTVATVTILDNETNLDPTADAGENQNLELLSGVGAVTPLTGAHFEYDAANNADGSKWASTTLNVYDWTFSAPQTAVDVDDPRFSALSKAYQFPGAQSSRSSVRNFINHQINGTWEFVIHVGEADGLIMESGGSGDGFQFWVEAGELKGHVRNGTPKATVTHPLTTEDKSRFIHVCYVIDNDGDSFKLYVDGVQRDTQTWTGTSWCGTNDAGLGIAAGGAATGFSTPFTGKIAVMRFYEGSAFDSNQVARNFFSLTGDTSTTATLSGSAEDPENQPMTATWSVESTQPENLAVLFEDTSSLNTTATFIQAGTYVLKLTVDDDFNQHSDLVTITVSESGSLSYDNWIVANFPNGSTATAMGSNPDGDPHSNMMEYAFGTDPALADFGPLAIDGSRHGQPLAKPDGEAGDVFTLYFMRRRDYATSGITYTVRFSSDLMNFENSSVEPTPVANSTSDSANYEVVKVAYPAWARFGSIGIDLAEP